MTTSLKPTSRRGLARMSELRWSRLYAGRKARQNWRAYLKREIHKADRRGARDDVAGRWAESSDGLPAPESSGA